MLTWLCADDGLDVLVDGCVSAEAVEGSLTLAVIPARDHCVQKLAKAKLADAPLSVPAALCVAAHHLQMT